MTDLDDFFAKKDKNKKNKKKGLSNDDFEKKFEVMNYSSKSKKYLTNLENFVQVIFFLSTKFLI